jgi:hypothetical protein
LNWTFPSGTHTVTFTVTDSAGHVAVCQFLVTITDTEPPIIGCPKGIITIPIGTNCLASLPAIPVKVADNCTPTSQLIITQSPPAGTLLPPGFHTITVTVTDPAGNQSTCTAVVRVLDLHAPIVKCPEPLTNVECEGTVPDIIGQIVVSNTCTPWDSLIITQSPPAGTVVGLGTHVISITVTDANGNTAVCSTTLTVSPPGTVSQPITLFNTGRNTDGTALADGLSDPHWSMWISFDPNFPGPDAIVVNSGSGIFGAWMPNDSNSKWIGARYDPFAVGNPSGGYAFRTFFNIPAGTTAANITGRWISAPGSQIFLNLNYTGHAKPNHSYGSWSQFNINSGFVPGLNSLAVAVLNDFNWSVGVRVELSGTATVCATNQCLAPFIAQAPLSLIRPAGSYATFNVSAGGTPALTYQWYFNSTAIAGATAPTLTVGPVNLSHAGLYSVLVSNDCGAVHSTEARLRVVRKWHSIVAQWDFESHRPLGATVGEDLEFLDGPEGETALFTVFGSTEDFGLPQIGGRPADVMRFAKTTPSMGYLARATVPSESRVSRTGNQHTFIWDLFYPEESGGLRRALLQTNFENNDEAEFAINEENAAGLEDHFAGLIPPNTWTRVAVAIDLESEPAIIAWFINGRKAGEQEIADEDRQRWSIVPSAEDVLRVLFFTDGGGQSEFGYVSSIQWHNVFLSELEIAALGAPSADGIPAFDPYVIEPAIRTDRDGDGLRLSWTGDDFKLQETSDLGSPSSWSDSALPIQSELIDNEITNEVIIPPTSSDQFYRLIENDRQ